jgi:hypothetical protein
VQFFMIGVVFLALPMALRPVFVAKNRELELIAWQTAGGLLIGGAVVVLIRHGASLTQLALADAAGLSLVSLALVWRGVRLLEVSAARVARYVVGWLVPFVYCASLLWAMKVYLPRWTGSDSPVVNDLTAIPLFVAVGAPLVWVAERTTGIVSKMRARGGPHPPSGEESGTDASTEGSDPSL